MKRKVFLMMFVFVLQKSFSQNFILNKDYLFTTDFIGGGMLSDVNRDGFPDILFADKRDIYMFINKATGKMQFEKIRVTSETSPSKVFQEYDFDNDGDKDILVGASGRVLILENKSTPEKFELVRFAKDLFYYGSLSTKVPSYFVKDLNQDGLVDVLVAYGDTKIGFQKTDKSFFIYDVPDADLDNVHKVESADLDRDGKPDFLLARNNSSGSAGLVYYLNSNNSFNFRRSAYNEPVRDFTLIDINQDSLPDVITLDYKNKNKVILLTNTGNPENLFKIDTLATTLPGNFSSFILTEIDNTPGLDIVAGFEQAAGISLLKSNGLNPDKWEQVTIPQSYGISEKVLVGDLDNDSDADIVQLLDDNGFLIYQNGTISATDALSERDWLQVFPNPTSTNLQVQAGAPIITARLWGADGQMQHIWKGVPTDKLTLEVDDLPAGAYTLEVTMADGRTARQKAVILD
jgi:hypothetical protein